MKIKNETECGRELPEINTKPNYCCTVHAPHNTLVTTTGPVCMLQGST